MKLMKRILQLTLACAMLPSLTYGIGINTFVAVPVAQNDWIFRMTDMVKDGDNAKGQGVNAVMGAVAYGISAKQMVMVMGQARAWPTKGAGNAVNAVTALYRGIIYQNDTLDSTTRVGLFGGADIPTTSYVPNNDGAVDGGFVATYFKNRNEFDTDFLWHQGLTNTPNKYRYDVSWQFRLSPQEFDEWGLGSLLNSVVEYGGRWSEVTKHTVEKGTLGVQWVNPQFVLEGGVTKDLNAPYDTVYLAGFRIHI